MTNGDAVASALAALTPQVKALVEQVRLLNENLSTEEAPDGGTEDLPARRV